MPDRHPFGPMPDILVRSFCDDGRAAPPSRKSPRNAPPDFIARRAAPKEKTMFATIAIASTVAAQGPVVEHHGDGRVTIATGTGRHVGWPLGRRVRHGLSALVIGLAGLGMVPLPAQAESLLNVSYDPTRELYRDMNAAFIAWPGSHKGTCPPTIDSSHGGSGAQARAVIEGLDAQVVTLALAADIDKIAEAGKLPDRLAVETAAQFCALYLDHRLPGARGEPQGHQGLGRPGPADGVEVITPNPKTSGGARWNYLAAWAWAEKNRPGSDRASSGRFTNMCRYWTRARATPRPPSRSAASATSCWPGKTRPTWRKRNWARISSTSWCPRSRSWPSRRWRWSRPISIPTNSAGWPRPIWISSTRPRRRRSSSGISIAAGTSLEGCARGRGALCRSWTLSTIAELWRLERRPRPGTLWRRRHLRPDLPGAIGAAAMRRTPDPAVPDAGPRAQHAGITLSHAFAWWSCLPDRRPSAEGRRR
jgi:hypothetical protein